QLVCFTAPMVGNYGVAPERTESGQVHARAVLMRQSGGDEWPRWLAAHGIVAVEGIDTRSLVLRLRDRGAMRAAAVAGPASLDAVLSDVGAWVEMGRCDVIDKCSALGPDTCGTRHDVLDVRV